MAKTAITPIITRVIVVSANVNPAPSIVKSNDLVPITLSEAPATLI